MKKLLFLLIFHQYISGQELYKKETLKKSAAIEQIPSLEEKESEENDDQLNIDSFPPEEIHQCNFPKCNKIFSRASLLLMHQKIHTDERHYQCTNCEKSFKRSDTLSQHMRTHTGEKPYQCSYEDCKRNFIQKSGLIRHMKTHLAPKRISLCNRKKKYKCDFQGCDKIFFWPALLTSHNRTHTGEKPFECKTCKKSFNHAGNLARHMNTIH